MPTIEVTPEQLADAIHRTGNRMRLNINQTDCGTLAREVMEILSPTERPFKKGDLVYWNHTYQDIEPCKAVVVEWPKKSSRLKIQYESPFWHDKGEQASCSVYPSELTHRKGEPKAAAPTVEPSDDGDSGPQADPAGEELRQEPEAQA